MTAPRLLLALHIAAAVVVATDLGGLPRIAVVGLWVSIGPGWSFLARVRLDLATKVSITVSTSLALALVVSTLLVLFDRYRWPTPFWLVFLVATPGVVRAQFWVAPRPTPMPEGCSDRVRVGPAADPKRVAGKRAARDGDQDPGPEG